MTSPVSVLREEPQFRLLFGGQVLSVLGDRVTMVVLPFAALSVGGGVAQVALVSAAQFIPFVLLALPAGVWADRLDRKGILIISDLTRLLTQLTAGMLLVTGHGSVGALIGLMAAYGAADAFFQPAFTGLLPATVRAHNLQKANALRSLSYSAGSIAGPALAGVLVALAGPGSALLFDAATFAVSVALLLRLRPRPPLVAEVVPDAPVAAPHFLADLRSGWSEVRGRSWILAFFAGMLVYHAIVLPAIFVVGPIVAERDLDGASSWALITVGFGVGSILGDLLLLRWRPRHAMRVSSLLLIGASCQAAFVGSGLTAWAIAGLELLAGVCVTGCFTLWETSLQEHVPSASLSRVSSYDYLTSAGMIPLGNILIGGVGAVIGLHPTLFAMTAVGVTAAVVIALVPAIRHLPRGATA